MRLSSIILVGIVGLVANTAAASSSTCCCYVKADTENCTEPYMTPSISTVNIGYPSISATLCCEDPNHQIFKSGWCEGSAGKEEQIDACGENQQCIDAINELSQQTSTSNSEYNDHANDTESLSVAEVNDSADATNITSLTINTTCSGESGAPDSWKYEIVTPTICNKESGLCASCDYIGPGGCSCGGTCADGSTLPELGCSTSERSYEYEDCNNEDPGVCSLYRDCRGSGCIESHKLTADGVDYYFVTTESCSGMSSAGTMLSSSSFVMLLLASVTVTIGVVGMLY